MPRLPTALDVGLQLPQGSGQIVPFKGDQIGQSLETAGARLMRVGDVVKEETDKLDTIQAQDRLNQLKLRRIELSMGEQGYHKVRGGDVLNSPFIDDYTDKFNSEIEALASTLQTPSQQEKFKRLASAELIGYKTDLTKHAMTEAAAHEKNVSAAKLTNAVEFAAANYNDEKKIISAHNEILTTAMEMQRRNGLSDEETEAGLRKAYTALYSRVIDAAVLANDVRTAEKYWEAHKDKFGVDEAVKTGAQVKKAREQVDVNEGVGAVISGVTLHPTPFDRAANLAGTPTRTQSGVDVRAAMKAGIYGQESKNGSLDTSKVNYAGATGPMQITADTWETFVNRGVIPKEWSWRNAEQNKKAGDMIVDYYFDKYNGDPEKVAAAYYAGEGAINKDGTINRHWRDLKNDKAPTVGQYVEQVLGKMKGAGATHFSVAMKANGNDYMKAWAAGIVGQEEVDKAVELQRKSEEYAKRVSSETEKLGTAGRLIEANLRAAGAPTPSDTARPRSWVSFLPESVQSELARRDVALNNGEGAKETTEADVRFAARREAAQRRLSPEATERLETKAVAEFKHREDAVKNERDRVAQSIRVRVENGLVTSIDDLTPQEKFAMGGHLHTVRSYIEAQRRSDDADKQLSPAATERYYTFITDPVALKSKSTTEIMAMAGDLGRDRVNKLLEKRAAYINSPEKERAAHIDNDMWNNLAIKFGFDRKNSKDKERLLSIRDRVEQVIIGKQEAEKRTLRRDEIEGVAKRMMTEVVANKMGRSWRTAWLTESAYPERMRVAEVEHPKDIIVPPEERQKIIEAASRAGRPVVTEREVIDLYVLKLANKRIRGE